MLDTIFATKREMTQVWTKQGKRLPVTRCVVDENVILGTQKCLVTDRSNSQYTKKPYLILEVGYGKKKLKNVTKPLRTIIQKSGFSFGFKQIKGIKVPLIEDSDESNYQVGKEVLIDDALKVGDVVKVQGVSKGKGFGGVVKRYGMRGGPKTRGQSDRHRAVGSIGGQTPGKVWKGKRMPGHLGDETVTVFNLTVIHIDQESKEVWLSGPVPGHFNSIIKIIKTGIINKIELDNQASGIKVLDEKDEKEESPAPEAKEEKLEDNSDKLKVEKAQKKTQKDTKTKTDK